MAHVLAYLTGKEKRALMQNSIERVINTSVRIIESSDKSDEDREMNLQDWAELKGLITKIFNNARDEQWQVLVAQEMKGKT